MNKQFLCIHGGLSPELQSLDDLKTVSAANHSLDYFGTFINNVPLSAD